MRSTPIRAARAGDFRPAGGIRSGVTVGRSQRNAGGILRRCGAHHVCAECANWRTDLEGPAGGSLRDHGHGNAAILQGSGLPAVRFVRRSAGARSEVRVLHVSRKRGGAGCRHGQEALANLHHCGNPEAHAQERRRGRSNSGLRARACGRARPSTSSSACLYVATGDNYSDPPTNTSDAILAMDLKSGELLWSKQLTENDAFNTACSIPRRTNCPEAKGPDYDFGQPPILVQSRRWKTRAGDRTEIGDGARHRSRSKGQDSVADAGR